MKILHLCIGTLVGLPAFGQPKPKLSSQTVLGVPCAEIFKRGIDKQDNLRASMVLVGCGLARGGDGLEAGDGVALSPNFLNLNLISGLETFPNVTQSESMIWANGDTIVANFNDSREINRNPLILSSLAVSFDGGQSFERIGPMSPLRGHGNNFGDPIVVYNQRLGLWFAGDLASGCGEFGIGLWTSPDAMTWSVGACAHNGANDDRESMWVDNNAASPWFGRMYISFNDFDRAGVPLVVTHSDDGVTWSAPIAVRTGFIRNVQITGSLGDDGTVFIAAMDEGGGGLSNPRTNVMYRSLDGGNNWSESVMGASFPAPGDSVCEGFASYFARIRPIWRQMGWGQPAAPGNGVVHYVYAAHGAGNDPGDILYTRSEDNGVTWSSPVMLNDDGTPQAQWMPSMSATFEGKLVATWYDRRSTDPTGLPYEYFMARSDDNGLSWSLNEAVSDVLIPQPAQPDPGIQSCYAGDYNYQTADSSKAYVTWTDGRVQIQGHNQQDVFYVGVDLLGPQTGGILQGTITDANTSTPIAGARVRALGPVDRWATANRDGFYRIRSPEGSYDVTVTAFRYLAESASGVAIVEGMTTTQDFALTTGPVHSVSGTVTNSFTGLPMRGATVSLVGRPIPPATTDTNGMYQLPMVPEETYDIQATAPGFTPSTQRVTVDQDVVVDFALLSLADCNRLFPGNLVINCGVETGDFTSWERSGNPNSTWIDMASRHSGSYGLHIGPVGSLGFIAQNVPTTAGATYSVCSHLRHLGGPPNRFQVSWGGTIIRDDTDLDFLEQWTCDSVVAASALTELKFGFQDLNFFQWDDASVVQQH